MQLTLLQAASAKALATAAAGLPGMLPGPFAPMVPQGGVQPQGGRPSSGKPAAAGGGGSKHDPATCKVRNCLRCRTASRAQASAAGSVAAGLQPTPGSTPSDTPRVGQRRPRQDSPNKRLVLPALQVQAAPTASSGGSGLLPAAAAPPAMSAAALMLWESHQQLDTLGGWQ